MRRSLTVAVAVLAAVAVALFIATRGATQNDRAAAQAFGVAAERFHAAVLAAVPEVEQRSEALKTQVCARALRRAPRRQRELLAQYMVTIQLDALYTPIRPAFDAFVAELNAIATEDPALRSGRAAWRSLATLIVREPVPAGACALLSAWRHAGQPRDALPAIPGLTLEQAELIVESDVVFKRKMDEGARRLRALGVSPQPARRFSSATHERLLDAANIQTSSS